MLVFMHPIKMIGVNVGEPVDIPAGAMATPLYKDANYCLILMQPEELKGLIVRGPVEEVTDATKEIADKGEDVTLIPFKGQGRETLGDDLEDVLSDVASELFKRQETGLAQSCITILAAPRSRGGGKHRTVRSPYPVDEWYSSKDPRIPLFFIDRLDSGDTFVIHTKDNNRMRRISWNDMMRADPKMLTIQECEELGIRIVPEQHPIPPDSPHFGVREKDQGV